MTTVHRRRWIQGAAMLSSTAVSSGAWLPRFIPASSAWAQTPTAAAPTTRSFNPVPGTWRHFEVNTRVDLLYPSGKSQVWLPVPDVQSDWQHVLAHQYRSNGRVRMSSDGEQGVRMVYAEFDADLPNPYIELISTVRTQNRHADWAAKPAPSHSKLSPAEQATWLKPTQLIPTDGIVRRTARQAIGKAKADEDKARAIYDWVVANSWREPKVRGCGEGDIKTMLETGNLGGKCADINALFVGLCRSVGLPARDVYGLRLGPSAFGYKELSGNPSNLKAAQHCRAEVHVAGRGWLAMDPADVAKVMRQESTSWIKDTQHPLVAPVYQGLWGGWEGNWLAYNMAHDVRLPHLDNTKASAASARLGFLMYPIGQTEQGRLDSYAADDFKYQITARELPVST